MQVESLNLKLRALMGMFDRLQPVQKREAGVTANVLLSMIACMKIEITADKAILVFCSKCIQHSWSYCSRNGDRRECKGGSGSL